VTWSTTTLIQLPVVSLTWPSYIVDLGLADGAAAAAVPESVKAKAAFWQLKEEQAKKAAVEQCAGRKQGGAAVGGCAGPAGGAPSYKSGANAR
jgi:hypothetical protein